MGDERSKLGSSWACGDSLDPRWSLSEGGRAWWLDWAALGTWRNKEESLFLAFFLLLLLFLEPLAWLGVLWEGCLEPPGVAGSWEHLNSHSVIFGVATMLLLLAFFLLLLAGKSSTSEILDMLGVDCMFEFLAGVSMAENTAEFELKARELADTQ